MPDEQAEYGNHEERRQESERANEWHREDSVWERLVASFDEEPTGRSWPDAEELTGHSSRGEAGNGENSPEGRREHGGFEDEDSGAETRADIGANGEDDPDSEKPGHAGGLPGSVLVDSHSPLGPPAPGPRDYVPDEDDPDEDDNEGHFAPPPPPPLPQLDTTSKFAWLGALGGPSLLILLVVLRQPLAWWAVLLGVGGFLGGFATLVARMKDSEDDEDDPYGGAVV